jgi:diketogulonate reductase-like aldo/keto reductase
LPAIRFYLYHLQERAIEHAVLPWCERHGVAVTAYSPFGHGNFPGSGTEGGRVLAKIAAAYEATPRQVALAFLTRRPSLFAIPKASPRRMPKRMPALAICSCRTRMLL